MRRPLVLGTLLGGLTLFLWGFVYHALLPFADQTLHPFSGGEQVAAAVAAAAPRSGTYAFPNMAGVATDEQRKAVEERVLRGPSVIAAVRVGGLDFGATLGKQLAIDLLCGFLATWLVLLARPVTLSGRVGFLVIVALAGWAARSLPSWNWYGFGTDYTISELVEVVVGFALAGVAIGKVAPK